MLRAAPLLVLLVLGAGWSDTANACSVRTAEGELEQRRWERRYLARESDLEVVGTFRADPEGLLSDNDYALYGTIEVGIGDDIKRYRVRIRGVINCGFPDYSIDDGAKGRFYLRHSEDPDPGDDEDGFIDDYSYVHFIKR